MKIKTDKILSFKKMLWSLVIVVATIILFGLIIFFLNLNAKDKDLQNLKINLPLKNNFTDQQAETCDNCLPDILTGELKPEASGYPLAVIVDNHLDARPALGLSQAKLVYEVPVEGGITRYLAIFSSDQEIEAIGPVRSARPYFIDWVEPLSALFVHCGGSPEALVDIIQKDIIDLNEFYNADYFWRDSSRPAPHNVITSSDKLSAYLEKNNLSKASLISWQFKADISPSKQAKEALEINIDYIADSHEVLWLYDQKTGKYIRNLAGEKHEDASGQIISAKTVIIKEVNSEVVDEKLRLKIDSQGEDKAVICFLGKCEEGSWKQTSASARERYYVNGEEVVFLPGNFWIEVVDQEVSYSY
ncbi:MAG: DUF3048 domain-containing protein [Candidatus Pacebacteria bacterium]|nr:DUF3048 domain-containing protein [Candidatus Paceibacterota bacterium]